MGGAAGGAGSDGAAGGNAAVFHAIETVGESCAGGSEAPKGGGDAGSCAVVSQRVGATGG